jgi:two-component system nitrate/nitrite response regulator NarL
VSPRGVSTVIIEPHLLMREGLTSVISHSSNDLVVSVSNAAELNDVSISKDGSAPLVLLGSAYRVDEAIAEADRVHEKWPGSKIVLLFEILSSAEIQRIFKSHISGCIPIFVSRDVLIKALDLVTLDDARIVVVAGTELESAREEPTRLQPEPDANVPGRADKTSPAEPVRLALDSPQRPSPSRNRNCPKLSGREVQILDGLVKGHANKIIARSCEITEATVKVHMKSILRKIQVANRTQAALWALENGYSTEDINSRLLQATSQE